MLDTSAVIAIVLNEEERSAFSALIAADDRVVISAASLFETAIVVATKKRDVRAADLIADFVRDLDIEVASFDGAAAAVAQAAYFRFGKGFHPARLNLADCFSYALAKSLEAPLLFKGDDFAQTDVRPAWRPRPEATR